MQWWDERVSYKFYLRSTGPFADKKCEPIIV